MQFLRDLFGLGSPSDDERRHGDTATVRKIARELEELEPERARYIACFAYLLSRVANADLDISAAETQHMIDILGRYGELPQDQAALAVEIAKSQARLFGGTENFQVAREFKRLASREQCEELLHCLFAVSAADDSISGPEEQQIRLIADELGLTHADYIAVRSSYNDKRSIFQS